MAAIELPRVDMKLRPRRRIALAATIDVRGRPVRLYNVHLDTRINKRRRLAQLEPVLEAANADHGDVVVIGGDLNTNPLRWTTSVLPTGRSRQADAVDAAMEREGFSAPLAKLGATHKTGPLGLRLDGLFARGAEVSDAGVERQVDSSDHWPIWIDLAWGEPTRTR